MKHELVDLYRVGKETWRVLGERRVKKASDKLAIMACAAKAALEFSSLVLASDEEPNPNLTMDDPQIASLRKQAHLREQGAALAASVGKQFQERKGTMYSEDHHFVDTHFIPGFIGQPYTVSTDPKTPQELYGRKGHLKPID